MPANIHSNVFTVLHDAAPRITLKDTMAAMPRISISLPENEYSELVALSEKHRISLAWLGRQAVAEFLERYESRELQLPLTMPPMRFGDK